jgi:hypothetical protein
MGVGEGGGGLVAPDAVQTTPRSDAVSNSNDRK